jgi:hypothetical protein
MDVYIIHTGSTYRKVVDSRIGMGTGGCNFGMCICLRPCVDMQMNILINVAFLDNTASDKVMRTTPLIITSGATPEDVITFLNSSDKTVLVAATNVPYRNGVPLVDEGVHQGCTVYVKTPRF